MKYETPELNPVPAIHAIQNTTQGKNLRLHVDHTTPGHPNPLGNEPGFGYADWEE